eukprot:447011-Pelagomonas_calceolata.AAC.1
MLDCCSARHVKEWAGLRIPTSELCTGAGALVQRHSRGNTMCGHCNACINARSNAHSNACSNARSNAHSNATLMMPSHMQSMYIMACSSAVKGVDSVPCLKPVRAGFANFSASLATLPPLVSFELAAACIGL